MVSHLVVYASIRTFFEELVPDLERKHLFENENWYLVLVVVVLDYNLEEHYDITVEVIPSVEEEILNSKDDQGIVDQPLYVVSNDFQEIKPVAVNL